jgi:hypothetical protein
MMTLDTVWFWIAFGSSVGVVAIAVIVTLVWINSRNRF